MPHRRGVRTFATIGLIVLPVVGCSPAPAPTTSPPISSSSNPSSSEPTALERSVGAFTATDEMIVGRFDHTATLLADGRVLVAGGRSSNDEQLASAELFDPETGTWSPAADMLTPITDPTATLLPDGRVLVVGNNDSTLYDPDTDAWEAATHVASIGPTSSGPATLLADGRVLITASMATPRLYDAADDSWSRTGPMLTPRYNHVATLLADGSVLVAGGDIPPDVGLISTERYDPATNSWMATGDISRPRTHMGTLLPDGMVLDVGWNLGGGPFGELYDADSGTWSSIEITVPLPGSGARAPLLHDGRVLFVSLDGSTALYDSTSSSWAIGPPMVLGRWVPSVTLLANGAVLVAGGVDGRLHGAGPPVGIASAELFSPGEFIPPAAGASTLPIGQPDEESSCIFLFIGCDPAPILEEAPLECAFPTGTKLAFAGEASAFELGLGLEHENQRARFYVTAEPVDRGQLAPPVRMACSLMERGRAMWEVPLDWTPPRVDQPGGE